MTSIQLPAMITVEDMEIPDPNDPYGLPVKLIITVRFGDIEIARYELVDDHLQGSFYFDGDNNNRILYDTPEEFVAYKLKKLFALID